MVGAFLELDIEEDITNQDVQIFVNRGFNLPQDLVASTTNFKVNAVWNGTTLIDDLSTTTTKTFTASAALTGAITEAALTMSNNNAGEVASYEFKFKNSLLLNATDKIEIYFPNTFDPFVGSASKWFTEGSDAASYYLKCSSTALGLVWCSVDKWKVTVEVSSSVEKLNLIDLKIEYVMNPVKGTTAQKVFVSIVDKDGLHTSVHNDFVTGGIAIAADPPAEIIKVKSVTAGSHDLFTNADYDFEFYLKSSLASTENIKVMFPMDYDLAID